MCVSTTWKRGRKAKQGKANKSTTPRTALSFEKSCPRWDSNPRHCSLALYQLSYQGNSAGRGLNLQHDTRLINLKPLCYGIVYSHSVWVIHMCVYTVDLVHFPGQRDYLFLCTHTQCRYIPSSTCDKRGRQIALNRQSCLSEHDGHYSCVYMCT